MALQVSLAKLPDLLTPLSARIEEGDRCVAARLSELEGCVASLAAKAASTAAVVDAVAAKPRTPAPPPVSPSVHNQHQQQQLVELAQAAADAAVHAALREATEPRLQALERRLNARLQETEAALASKAGVAEASALREQAQALWAEFRALDARVGSARDEATSRLAAASDSLHRQLQLLSADVADVRSGGCSPRPRCCSAAADGAGGLVLGAAACHPTPASVSERPNRTGFSPAAAQGSKRSGGDAGLCQGCCVCRAAGGLVPGVVDAADVGAIGSDSGSHASPPPRRTEERRRSQSSAEPPPWNREEKSPHPRGGQPPAPSTLQAQGSSAYALQLQLQVTRADVQAVHAEVQGILKLLGMRAAHTHDGHGASATGGVERDGGESPASGATLTLTPGTAIATLRAALTQLQDRIFHTEIAFEEGRRDASAVRGDSIELKDAALRQAAVLHTLEAQVTSLASRLSEVEAVLCLLAPTLSASADKTAWRSGGRDHGGSSRHSSGASLERLPREAVERDSRNDQARAHSWSRPESAGARAAAEHAPQWQQGGVSPSGSTAADMIGRPRQMATSPALWSSPPPAPSAPSAARGHSLGADKQSSAQQSKHSRGLSDIQAAVAGLPVLSGAHDPFQAADLSPGLSSGAVRWSGMSGGGSSRR